MQDPNELYSSDTIFNTQLNYTNSIMTKISELQFSLRFGRDCTREFSNLLFLLTDGIKNPIEPELKKISLIHEKNVKEIRNMTKFPETTFKWSFRHKQRYLGVLINREQSDAILEMLIVIINQLDKMGLLLHRDRQTQI